MDPKRGGPVLETRTRKTTVRTISVYQPDDTLNVIDLLLVTDLEIKPTTNGSSKRRKA